MKTFIYSTKYKNTTYGQNVTVTIYRLKNNKPEYLGETVFNTGSMMGVEHEVNSYLVKNKHLPKTYVRNKGSFYINYDKYGQDRDYYFYSI